MRYFAKPAGHHNDRVGWTGFVVPPRPAWATARRLGGLASPPLGASPADFSLRTDVAKVRRPRRRSPGVDAEAPDPAGGSAVVAEYGVGLQTLRVGGDQAGIRREARDSRPSGQRKVVGRLLGPPARLTVRRAMPTECDSARRARTMARRSPRRSRESARSRALWRRRQPTSGSRKSQSSIAPRHGC